MFLSLFWCRMLEMDFMATLTYGTDFNASDYNGLTTHVLESLEVNYRISNLQI